MDEYDAMTPKQLADECRKLNEQFVIANQMRFDEIEDLKKQEGHHALNGKYGEVLNPFLVMMEAELHANAGKGDRPGWLSMSRNQGMLEIYYHTAKLQKAVKNNDIDLIREHSADVANMAMMILDVCGGLSAR